MAENGKQESKYNVVTHNLRREDEAALQEGQSIVPLFISFCDALLTKVESATKTLDDQVGPPYLFTHVTLSSLGLQ